MPDEKTGRLDEEFVVQMKGITKVYPNGVAANQGVDFNLRKGEIHALMGENGAGKSTLIRMMLGACRPDGGEVRVLGEKAGRTAAFTKVRQDIGVVLDEACLPDELTAQQVGKMMHGIYANWDDAAFSSLCARLDLPKGKKVKDFSRGMKMKLALAVALSHRAKLLLLDEATSGLDPMVREEVLDILLDFTREVCAHAEQVNALVGIEPVALHTLHTPELTRRLIADVNSPNLRVILDTANLVTPESTAPEAQMEILERALSCFGERICALHVKDGVFGREGKWENRPLGQGVMDWPRLLPRLREHNDTLCALREGVFPGMAKEECQIMHRWLGE